MEVSNISVAIAPPIFSQGTEEAKKESAARETIPQPSPAAESAKENLTGSNSSVSTNSLLYAQSQNLVQNTDQQGKDRDKEQQSKEKEKKSDPVETLKQPENNHQSEESSSLRTRSSYQWHTGITAHLPIDSLAKKNYNRQIHAKYSPSITQGLSSNSKQRLNAIAGRYNATGRGSLLGQHIDSLV